MLNPKFTEDYETYNRLRDAWKKAYDAGKEEAANKAQEDISKFCERIKSEEDDYQRLFSELAGSWGKGNKDLDIGRVIHDERIPAMVESFRKYGIERFTISVGQMDMQKTIWIFQQNGCKLEGLEEVVKFVDGWTGETETAQAFVLSVQ